MTHDWGHMNARFGRIGRRAWTGLARGAASPKPSAARCGSCLNIGGSLSRAATTLARPHAPHTRFPALVCPAAQQVASCHGIYHCIALHAIEAPLKTKSPLFAAMLCYFDRGAHTLSVDLCVVPLASRRPPFAFLALASLLTSALSLPCRATELRHARRAGPGRHVVPLCHDPFY